MQLMKKCGLQSHYRHGAKEIDNKKKAVPLYTVVALGGEEL
jgi:hypothetical protein